jgi:hypothetical protein
MMKRLLLALLVVPAAAFLGAPNGQAACPEPVPMAHALDGYFACPDIGRVAAFAYQQSAPADVNTGTETILCAAFDGVRCQGASGLPDDGRMTVETDWMNPGVLGCPVGPDGPQRVVIVAATSAPMSGSSLLVSLGGTSPDLGYLVEAAHPYDPAENTFAPLACEDSALVISRTSDQALMRFTLPPVRSDCDPGTVGSEYPDLGLCADGFRADVRLGTVYTLRQPCTEPIDLGRGGWTATTAAPDSTGLVTVPAETAPSDNCVYAGITALINGQESEAIAAFAWLECADSDLDGDGYTDCVDCDDGDPAIHPGAQEICNQRDDDCDGRVDESEDLGGDSDGDEIGAVCDNCPDVPNPAQEDRDADGVGDACDNCPSVPNEDQADRDEDRVGDACDNCPDTPNSDQQDADSDGIGDVCDVCPTIPNPANDPCDCEAPGCENPPFNLNLTINFSSPEGRGSGLVTWDTGPEVILHGFNIITFNARGERIQLNDVLIPCQECITGLGAHYEVIIPKHKSGRNIFLEMLRLDGLIFVFGPAEIVR